MKNIESLNGIFRYFPHWLVRMIENLMQKIPSVKLMIDAENEKMMAPLEASLKPYRGKFDSFAALPATSRPRKTILEDIQKMNQIESDRWKDGYVSGGIYHGDQEHIDFLNQVYALHSQSNPLHSDLFPSATKFEAEIVSMVAGMLGGGTPSAPSVVGTVTSGGTESILLAMKTYRDRARAERGIYEPEIIVAETAHAAFDKASQYFGINMVKVPVDSNFKMDLSRVKRAIGSKTVALVGSSPSFPHGIIDPIEGLSELATKYKLGLHVDACLGGFILPFARKLGAPVPAFDFNLPAVTSMSVDTHKYGFAAKGTSVVLYRTPELRHYQYYTTTEWPGGLYFSPTLAGSRPGALSAACWAAMLSMGEEGYLRSTRAILDTAAKIREGLKSIPELRLLGDPIWIFALASDTVNIYEVLDQMNQRHWSLNGLHKPSCFHFALTLRQTQPGVAERFLQDLKDSVAYVKKNPSPNEGLAPVYGMAASLPFRVILSDVLKKYLDIVYKV